MAILPNLQPPPLEGVSITAVIIYQKCCAYFSFLRQLNAEFRKMDLNDKYSIKNLLFTKAIPNYEIPHPVDGHKIYPCTDCGDKFMFESSYQYHVNRRSVQITYMCRHCNQTKIFFNRCKLLHHIRSHAFRTATINVQDLKVDPVPLTFYKLQQKQKSNPTAQTADTPKKSQACFECKIDITSVGPAYKERASHYMKYTNEVHTCPICLFTLPTLCGLRTHMRFHLKTPPYFCPECGLHLSNRSVQYPYNHDCDGFKMMRVTARVKCPVNGCSLLHPNDFKDHMKEQHLKKVYKCPYCVVACFNEQTMENHLKGHGAEIGKALIFHQCEICPGRLVVPPHMDNHLKSHARVHIYPCWTCGAVFNTTNALVEHLITTHDSLSEDVKNIYKSLGTDFMNEGKQKRIYKVVKRCDQCKRNFTYRCNYNEIAVLPNECPYKCKSTFRSDVTESETNSNMIKCNLCNMKISQDWGMVKKHYAKKHKNYRCLDAKLSIERINVKNLRSKLKRSLKRSTSRKLRSRKLDDKQLEKSDQPMVMGEHICKKCEHVCETKQMLETHMVTHRDTCMAYQCLDCGQSFAVKPSFSKHLLLEHGITDAEAYIKEKRCYNENAFEKYHDGKSSNEPLKENQCKICRDQFNNSEDLEKHFRIHGMAFLLKSTSTKS